MTYLNSELIFGEQNSRWASGIEYVFLLARTHRCLFFHFVEFWKINIVTFTKYGLKGTKLISVMKRIDLARLLFHVSRVSWKSVKILYYSKTNWKNVTANKNRQIEPRMFYKSKTVFCKKRSSQCRICKPFNMGSFHKKH